MKKYIFFILIFNTISLSSFATDFVTKTKANNTVEVEELAPADSMPIEYFPTKPATSIMRAFNSMKGMTIDIDLIKSSLMIPHTNPVRVMSTIDTKPIFWGVSWHNPKFYSDKIFGLMHFYENFQDSTYAGTVSEYLPDQLNHYAFGSVIDSSPASQDPRQVLAKVCEIAGAVSSNSNYYPVYVDIKRGNAGYCAYHSAGICGGRPVQFAFFFNIDDDPACDPLSPYAPMFRALNSQKPGTVAGVNSNYQQSQGLAALANVTAHELVEVITDPAYFPPDQLPYWGGWFDAFGREVADKCAWTFGPSNTGLSPGTVTIGGVDWKLQGAWSNNAHTTGEGGYSTKDGTSILKGCITGS